jgi:hypothetical protein
MRIFKLTKLFDFKKILESRVDINLKIAKILTNALNWKIDFNAFKGCKYSIAFPITLANITPSLTADRPSEEFKS